jgi:hypothetical protein
LRVVDIARGGPGSRGGRGCEGGRFRERRRLLGIENGIKLYPDEDKKNESRYVPAHRWIQNITDFTSTSVIWKAGIAGAELQKPDKSREG